MLGMQDVWITMAWLLSIISSLLCVAFGAVKWHYDEE